jgi:hypothetical protein
MSKRPAFRGQISLRCGNGKDLARRSDIGNVGLIYFREDLTENRDYSLGLILQKNGAKNEEFGT